MEKLLIITELDQLKSISDPFRLQLLSMIAEEAKTGQMLADELEMPRAKVHYHLNQLLSHNIITVAYTMEKNSIIQKFYRPAAEKIVPSINIFNINKENDAESLEAYEILMNDTEQRKLTDELSRLQKRKKAKKETATANEYAVYVMKNMREA